MTDHPQTSKFSMNDTSKLALVIIICVCAITAGIWNATIKAHERRQAAAVSCHENGGQWIEATTTRLCINAGR